RRGAARRKKQLLASSDAGAFSAASRPNLGSLSRCQPPLLQRGLEGYLLSPLQEHPVLPGLLARSDRRVRPRRLAQCCTSPSPAIIVWGVLPWPWPTEMSGHDLDYVYDHDLLRLSWN